jgi:hypothetical protein
MHCRKRQATMLMVGDVLMRCFLSYCIMPDSMLEEPHQTRQFQVHRPPPLGKEETMTLL